MNNKAIAIIVALIILVGIVFFISSNSAVTPTDMTSTDNTSTINDALNSLAAENASTTTTDIGTTTPTISDMNMGTTSTSH
jgi:hypothetical protein